MENVSTIQIFMATFFCLVCGLQSGTFKKTEPVEPSRSLFERCKLAVKLRDAAIAANAAKNYRCNQLTNVCTTGNARGLISLPEGKVIMYFLFNSLHDLENGYSGAPAR